MKELTERMCVKSFATFEGDIPLVAQLAIRSRLTAIRDDRHWVIGRLVNVPGTRKGYATVVREFSRILRGQRTYS